MARSTESVPERTGGWRLSGESSTYLRSAAQQPIEWYPWGEEAFELAKRTNRPILLDVGASWCHWCHVMDEGTYSDPEVARLLRQHFVAVKVDRDEHPEIDRRYQRQVGALTGEGGWPLTGFLTPEGEVFLGGTYFPPQDGMGRPGFRRVLKEVARLWKDEPEKIRQNSSAVKEALDRSRRVSGGGVSSTSAFLGAVRGQINESYDPVNGGFGLAPKFPHATAIPLLLFDSFSTGQPLSETRARETLLKMADGGVYDQVGGGFHRYAVDEGWHIPHFEKMGNDNAALLESYVDGARRFGDARLIETIRGSTAWILDVLGDPNGGFAASQDADNAPGDDGSYFTWSRSQLRSVLDSDEFRLITRFFGVGSEGRMPHDPDQNVLFRLMTAREAAEGLPLSEEEALRKIGEATQKLRTARSGRATPKVDRALYASLNGSFVRALTHASRLLGDEVPLAQARRAADRFLSAATNPDRGIAHRLDVGGASGFGLLEDQAEFALGLVELAGATLEPKYVAAAEALLKLVDAEYRGEDGLLRDISPRLYDGPPLGSLSEATYSLEDNPHLAANAAVALAFLRLASLTNQERWREKAQALLEPVQARIGKAGLFASGSAFAAGLLSTPPGRVVVEGLGPEANALVRAAESSWHPNLWVFRGVPPEPFSLPEELNAAAGGTAAARALVCFGTRCLAPVTDPARLPDLLRDGGRSVT